MKTHILKIKHEDFENILNLQQRFVICQDNRAFEVGDHLELHELTTEDYFSHMSSQRSKIATYTGHILTVKVNSIMRDGVGLARYYVAMGIARVEISESKMNKLTSKAV